ncbi:MAG: hypothetical protein QNI90_07095 [Dinoroseobacter sp.]|nr:hypothetical protein [Dinoroseobacter sp.]
MVVIGFIVGLGSAGLAMVAFDVNLLMALGVYSLAGTAAVLLAALVRVAICCPPQFVEEVELEEAREAV